MKRPWRYQRHNLPRELFHGFPLARHAVGGEAQDEVLDAQVLVLAQVGGYLLRYPVHHPAGGTHAAVKYHVGAEAGRNGVLGPSGAER